jgi:CO/xanthine dehydrogenase FAD-binding subunit
VGILHLEQLIRPTSLDAALDALRRGGEGARPIGGGIDLVRFTPPGVTTLVDLTGLALDAIDVSAEGVRIGATTTLAALEREPALATYADGVLRSALGEVGSRQLRNLATIGGALVGAHPWSDVVTTLLALDATVSLNDGERRAIGLAELAAARGTTGGGIVTEVHLPPERGAVRAAFVKFARTAFDVGMLNVCVAAELDDQRCRRATVVVGGTPWLATALSHAGSALQGAKLDHETIAAVAEVAASEARLGDDRRASADYRRTLVEVGVRRALERIADSGEGGHR